MVQTKTGKETFVTKENMDAPSPASASGPNMMEKARANENARLANEIWFNKFSDGPTLGNLMQNFDAWNIYIIEVTTEKSCRGLLTMIPGHDSIRINHAKNIQMFFNRTICEDLKDVVLEATAKDRYEMLLSFKPDSSEKRVELLKAVNDIDSSNIEAYVIAMQHLQKQLRDIDSTSSHYYSKPSAHLSRLLENLSDEQTDKIQKYRK